MDARMLGVLIPIIAIAGFFSWMIALSPVGKAVAERILGTGGRRRGQRSEADDEEREHMLGTLEQLQERVNELEERLDFAERMIAQHREGANLPPPR
jgi:hypothetical protein